MNYFVKIPSTGIHIYSVAADSPKDAINRVAGGEVDFYESTEIDESLDTNTWEVECESD